VIELKRKWVNALNKFLHVLCNSAWHSEPYHENQNFAENQYATIKATTNRVLNLSGVPDDSWLLALLYVYLLLNHLTSSALGWKTLIRALAGQIPDTSKFLHFSSYEAVYYHSHSDTYPSAWNEEQGWWVGVATHVGDELTYKILTQKQRLICRSAIRSAINPDKRNQRLSPLGGETVSNYLGDKNFIWSKTDSVEFSIEDGIVLDDDPSVQRRMVTIDPKDLIGRTFLKDLEEDGQRFRDRAVHAVLDNEDNMKKDAQYMKFICEVPNLKVDEMYTYNETLDHIEKVKYDIENYTEKLYKFRHITAHQGALR
jgi:hypothetical protein